MKATNRPSGVTSCNDSTPLAARVSAGSSGLRREAGGEVGVVLAGAGVAVAAVGAGGVDAGHLDDDRRRCDLRPEDVLEVVGVPDVTGQGVVEAEERGVPAVRGDGHAVPAGLAR